MKKQKRLKRPKKKKKTNRKGNRQDEKAHMGFLFFPTKKMKGYYVYEGFVYHLGEPVHDDIYKVIVCADNKKDAIHKIKYRWKLEYGYESDFDIRIDEDKVIGGFEIG